MKALSRPRRPRRVTVRAPVRAVDVRAGIVLLLACACAAATPGIARRHPQPSIAPGLRARSGWRRAKGRERRWNRRPRRPEIPDARSL